jgi:hypothetical protein
VNRTGTSGIKPNLITEMPRIIKSKSKIIIASRKDTFFFIKILHKKSPVEINQQDALPWYHLSTACLQHSHQVITALIVAE